MPMGYRFITSILIVVVRVHIRLLRAPPPPNIIIINLELQQLLKDVAIKELRDSAAFSPARWHVFIPISVILWIKDSVQRYGKYVTDESFTDETFKL